MNLVYSNEKAVFYREHNDRAYSLEAFFLQYTALELPFEITSSLIFAIFADLAVGLPRTADSYFLVVYCCFCIVNCGESLGIMFNTIFDHTGFAVSVVSIFLSLAQVMSGPNSIDMPGFLQGANCLSPLKFAVGILARCTFDGIEFTCNESQRLSNGNCPVETGEQALQLYKLDKTLWVNILVLGILTFAYRLVAYAILKIVRERLFSRLRRRDRKT
jgi:ABC-type multidrug transport system permease subunit